MHGGEIPGHTCVATNRFLAIVQLDNIDIICIPSPITRTLITNMQSHRRQHANHYQKDDPHSIHEFYAEAIDALSKRKITDAEGVHDVVYSIQYYARTHREATDSKTTVRSSGSSHLFLSGNVAAMGA